MMRKFMSKWKIGAVLVYIVNALMAIKTGSKPYIIFAVALLCYGCWEVYKTHSKDIDSVTEN